jgi:hypothetical protein
MDMGMGYMDRIGAAFTSGLCRTCFFFSFFTLERYPPFLSFPGFLLLSGSVQVRSGHSGLCTFSETEVRRTDEQTDDDDDGGIEEDGLGLGRDSSDSSGRERDLS